MLEASRGGQVADLERDYATAIDHEQDFLTCADLERTYDNCSIGDDDNGQR
jgi:hypothetical protein